MKLKRLFTAVLSTALALSLCAMPAMAVEGATGTGTTPEDVWTQGTGTITIHKYEYNAPAKAQMREKFLILLKPNHWKVLSSAFIRL